MQTYYFSLSVSYDDCQVLYVPGNNAVIITDDNGKRIQLPSKNLRPFVSPFGLKGRFRLQTSRDNKIVNLQKIA